MLPQQQTNKFEASGTWWNLIKHAPQYFYVVLPTTTELHQFQDAVSVFGASDRVEKMWVYGSL